MGQMPNPNMGMPNMYYNSNMGMMPPTMGMMP